MTDSFDDKTQKKKQFVGHPMPPVEYRFKKGQSGNPKGRPKGARSTYKILDDILNKRVQLIQDGKRVNLDRRTIILLQTVQSAMKGNAKAVQTLLPHMLEVDERKEAIKNTHEMLTTDDQKIIEQFLKDNKNDEPSA